MKKLELKKSSTIVAGGCSGLMRRISGQIAKGHLRRAGRMMDRYDRRC